MKRDFYPDVYTILKRIKFTIWTICDIKDERSCSFKTMIYKQVAMMSTIKILMIFHFIYQISSFYCDVCKSSTLNPLGRVIKKRFDASNGRICSSALRARDQVGISCTLCTNWRLGLVCQSVLAYESPPDELNMLKEKLIRLYSHCKEGN